MKYVAILLAEGFEEVEALLPCDFLRRAEIVTKLVSISEDLLVKGAHDITVQADMHLSEVQVADLLGVIVPGGMPGTKHLAENLAVIRLLNDAHAQGKIVGAICASPAIVMPKTNFFAEKTFTCTPSQRDLLADKKYYIEAPVVIDGKVITSRGPGTTAHFTHAIIQELKSKEIADALFTRALFHLEEC
ncbi:DJ-1 family glyoxalase III [Entomospira culicis]|uniref:DJ-1/PfpI family protein n=1 Tax=Entomospira culicis TaxID=2719989 RepID=A0A968KWV8_9SPIO|nr:DJ-1 family glyoxalase III [Entomospira culicis]NIZ19413.1 DJ-1/PfpI family protein [Entomospira culicis]NIZ69682.1 DJ-1/PfpI family protein [Entomospira culicis]WDI36792.1 DJ-1/PfpI family protein [Entomospira culicis]WDI38421.1 DJ-1/PfpI family protein [Entomospira culicis]